MLSPRQLGTELFGTTDDVAISDIFQSSNNPRTRSSNIVELADSISRAGLLSPILVRVATNGKFEVVAGNRRFKACKSLGWKKIPCQIVELDEKSAFEASIIENIQRNSLNVIEEGMAFRKYVHEFGYGAATELARRLSKSSSYISKRMRLLELPDDVLQMLSDSEISVTTGEELFSIKDRSKQSKFAIMAVKESMTSRSVRKLIKDKNCHEDNYDDLYYSGSKGEHEKFLKAFDKSIIALRIAMNRMAMITEKIEENWALHEILMNHKNTIHSQIDLLIREKKKFVNNDRFFRVNFRTYQR